MKPTRCLLYIHSVSLRLYDDNATIVRTYACQNKALIPHIIITLLASAMLAHITFSLLAEYDKKRASLP